MDGYLNQTYGKSRQIFSYPVIWMEIYQTDEGPDRYFLTLLSGWRPIRFMKVLSDWFFVSIWLFITRKSSTASRTSVLTLSFDPLYKIAQSEWNENVKHHQYLIKQYRSAHYEESLKRVIFSNSSNRNNTKSTSRTKLFITKKPWHMKLGIKVLSRNWCKYVAGLNRQVN